MYIPPTGHQLNIIKRSSFWFLESGIPTLWSVARPTRVIPGEENPIPTEHEESDFYKHRDVLYRPKNRNKYRQQNFCYVCNMHNISRWKQTISIVLTAIIIVQ
jgi:hypothetical protein